MSKVTELGMTEEEKTHTATTKDGQMWDGDKFDSVMCLLAECSTKMLKDIEKIDLFKRMTVNFIQSNTDADLKEYIKHRLTIELVDMITKGL